MNGTMFDGIVGRAAAPHVGAAHDKADRIIDLLAGIFEAVSVSPEDFTEKVQRKLTARTQGTGTVLVDMGMVPNGANWQITRLAVQGGPTLGARVWLDSVGDGFLIDKIVTDAAGDYADTVGENPIVREGRRVIVEFIGQPAAQLCSVFLQVDQFQEHARTKV